MQAGRAAWQATGALVMSTWELSAMAEVLGKAELANHPDLGALRLRLVATKDRPCPDFPYKDAAGKYLPEVVLDFDYWGIVLR